MLNKYENWNELCKAESSRTDYMGWVGKKGWVDMVDSGNWKGSILWKIL